MDRKVQKHIVDFFSIFQTFNNAVSTKLKECQEIALDINKFIKRCNNILHADVNDSPLEKFEGLQNKLCSSLLDCISQCALKIRKNLIILKDLYKNVCFSYNSLVLISKDVNFDEPSPLVTGTAFQPPLKQLLEFAVDIIAFGAQICAQIETSLDVLTIRELNSNIARENFTIPQNYKQRIPEIIAYTSLLGEYQSYESDIQKWIS